MLRVRRERYMEVTVFITNPVATKALRLVSMKAKSSWPRNRCKITQNLPR